MLLPSMRAFFLSAFCLLADDGYKRAPERIRAILDAPTTPVISVNPTKTHALLLDQRRYPPIAELAQPMLRLAGLRLNPKNNAPHRNAGYSGLKLIRLDTGAEIPVGFSGTGPVSAPRWTGDGKWFAVLIQHDDRVEAWVGRVETGEFRRVVAGVNSAWGTPLQWMGDNRHLLVQMIPADRGAAPAPPVVPSGPVIQESAGKAGPSRTNPDALKNPYDETLFEYYTRSQLTVVDVATGSRTKIGEPALVEDVSPDGRQILVTRLERPYSYVLTAWEFPKSIEVWDSAGKLLKALTRRPLADRVPIEGVVTGPRDFEWVPSEPATLVWAEALDEGDPKRKAGFRDKLLTASAPFDNSKEWFRTQHRYMRAQWLERGQRALVSDYDRDRRWTRTQLVSLDGIAAPKTLWSRNIRDAYANPGAPLTRRVPNGKLAVALGPGETLLLDGEGSSPIGDRPFLDRYSLPTGTTERLFHSDANAYETVVTALDDAGNRVLTRRETKVDPPNFLVRDQGQIKLRLTDVKDPAPELRKVTKQIVTYKRADGVPLSFTLYLPPDYQPGQRLRTVVWAYPQEFNDAATAGQVRGSQHRFTTITGPSHLFFLLAGYAILDGATMPVVGDPATANNTYIEQIVSSARAAIDKAAEMGWTDPKRVGVGGHSYGAFMTANLLAHSDLFRAGIARSGAYNRTLTPFGFQAERRTLWEAPSIYFGMSPFLAANKINEPILLIHGEADDNQGTFPIQSERMYQALRGNGGTVRYVVLPHEAHGYAARESVEHTIAEMIDWFDKHL